MQKQILEQKQGSPDEKYLSSWIQQYLKPLAPGHFQLSEPINFFFLLSQWELEDNAPCLICTSP